MAFFCRFPFVSLLTVCFILYLPVFLIPFSFHNDGSIVSSKSGDLLSAFDESHWIFMIGRPLYTVYLNLQTKVIHTVAGLSGSRFFYFFQLGLALLIFWRFLQSRCRLDVFWLWLIGLAFFFTPFNLLSFLWVEMEAVGAPTIILTGLSYYCLDLSFAKLRPNSFWGAKVGPILLAAVAAIFFAMALCIYPSTALMVFVFTFARILFLPPDNKKRLRRLITRDILFFGILMGAYLVFVKTVIFPFGVRHFQMVIPGGLYAFSLTKSVVSKMNLFVELVGYSLRGSWDLIGSAPANWILFVFFTMVCVLGRDNFAKYFRHLSADRGARASFFERMIWGLILVLLANSPLILAGGCDHFLGYRVLLPSTMMLMMVVLKIFMMVDSVKTSRQPNPFLTGRSLAVLFTVGMAIVSVWMQGLVVRNNHLEYVRARTQLAAIDFSRVNRLMFLLNPKENRASSGLVLPGEFGLMSASKNHAAAYLSGVLKAPRLSWPLVQAAEAGETVYLTPQTGIVDLTINRQESAAVLDRRDVVLFHPSSVLRDLVLIDIVDGKETGVLLTFKTATQGKYLPFWPIIAGEEYAVLQIDCVTQPKILSQYVSFIESRGAPSAQKNIAWRLQASHDGKVWMNMDSYKTNNIYNVVAPKAFRYYRFSWGKEDPSQKIYIHALKLILT